MAIWRFKDFVTERGENDIRRWLDTLPKAAAFKFDVRIRYLENVPQLKMPYVEKWVGEKDLYEVRVVSNNVQYRALGCYGSGQREFTLLVGAIEKGGQLEPRNVVSTAKARMTQIGDENHVCGHFD